MDIKGLLQGAAMPPNFEDIYDNAMINYGPGYTQYGPIPGYGTENVFGQTGNRLIPGFNPSYKYTQPANGAAGMNTAMAPNMGQVNEANEGIYFGSGGQSTDQDTQRQSVLRGLLEAYM